MVLVKIKFFMFHFFSEIYADETEKPTTNISFIGSLFTSRDTEMFQSFIQESPSREEWKMMKKCFDELKKSTDNADRDGL